MLAPEAEQASKALAALAPPDLLRALAGGLIIDLDDTLTVNTPLFRRSRYAICTLLEPFDPAGALALAERHLEISNSLVPTLGFTPKRWYAAGEQLAAECFSVLADEERNTLDQAIEIGLGVGEFYPGVERTLAALAAAGVPMSLLTKGEPSKQAEKVAVHGLDPIFGGRIDIVDRKSGELLSEIAGFYGFSDPVVIGESEASDIAPAREAGMRSVLVDREHGWSVEKLGGVDGTPRAPSFPEALLGLVRNDL
jgi:putative hydrolase of the HAD superfamily